MKFCSIYFKFNFDDIFNMNSYLEDYDLLNNNIFRRNINYSFEKLGALMEYLKYTCANAVTFNLLRL